MSVQLGKYFKFVVDCSRDLLESRLNGYTCSYNNSEAIYQNLHESKDMEILFRTESYGKSLSLEYSEGDNISGETYCSLNFSIRLLSPKVGVQGRTYFDIGDYYKFRRIGRNPRGFFFAENESSDKKRIKAFIHEVEYLLKEHEIIRLLNSNKWIEVPQDRSMYF